MSHIIHGHGFLFGNIFIRDYTKLPEGPVPTLIGLLVVEYWRYIIYYNGTIGEGAAA